MTEDKDQRAVIERIGSDCQRIIGGQVAVARLLTITASREVSDIEDDVLFNPFNPELEPNQAEGFDEVIGHFRYSLRRRETGTV